MSVTKINYSAIYVVMATVFVLVVHTVDPTTIVGVVLAILIPMPIILGFCNCFEMDKHKKMHKHKDRLSRKELEELEQLKDDPDWDYYASMMN